VIRIRDIKFNDSQFFNLKNIDLNHFLHKKVKQIIKIINIQFSISSSLIIIINSKINKSSYSLKNSKFSTLLNSALISFTDLNSILNQLFISEFISELFNIFNLFK